MSMTLQERACAHAAGRNLDIFTHENRLGAFQEQVLCVERGTTPALSRPCRELMHLTPKELMVHLQSEAEAILREFEAVAAEAVQNYCKQEQRQGTLQAKRARGLGLDHAVVAFAQAKVKADAEEADFKRREAGVEVSEEERLSWLLKGRRELYAPALEAWHAFFEASRVLADALIAKGVHREEGDAPNSGRTAV